MYHPPMKNNLLIYTLKVWISFFIVRLVLNFAYFKYMDYTIIKATHEHSIMRFYDDTIVTSMPLRVLELLPLYLLLYFTAKKLGTMSLSMLKVKGIIMALLLVYGLAIILSFGHIPNMGTVIMLLLSGLLSVLPYKLPGGHKSL